MKRSLVLTCEHGGNRIPPRYAALFAGQKAVLATHRGYDIGAAVVATSLAGALRAPLFLADTSRLVVDLNRSLHHRAAFSEWTRDLDDAEKQRIVDEYYWPHRRAVEAAAERERRRGRFVLHLAVHSFTPVLDGEVRRADIGLLYDPKRAAERAFATELIAKLRDRAPELVVRRNYPYRGASDGFTKVLRRAHSNRAYAGVELEINQGRIGSRSAALRDAALLGDVLRSVR